MFNVTIINAKKSIIKLINLTVIILSMFFITQKIKELKTNQILQINISEKFIKCLSSEIPAISSTTYKTYNLKEDKEKENTTLSEKILDIELARVLPNNIQEEEFIEKEEPQETEQTQQEVATVETNVVTDVATEIVTQNPITENCNVELNGVKIKNETSFEINESILNTELGINKNNILIFHTHTCESYTPTEQYNYQQTGNFRTTDLNFSVARVGDELTNYLMGYGFNVVHDKTYHDYPAYTGSYTRSKTTVENILQSNPTDIIIDLHRDAIGSKSNYDPSVKIGDDVAAQLMFVIGTNGGGLYHPNWQTNLKFAIEFQQKANEMYPGLFKTMIVRNSRYNQHLGKAATIIEVGSTGNTLEQCMNSMKYLSKVLDEYRK